MTPNNAVQAPTIRINFTCGGQYMTYSWVSCYSGKRQEVGIKIDPLAGPVFMAEAMREFALKLEDHNWRDKMTNSRENNP